LALLTKGWRVLAVDQQPEAIDWVQSRLPPEQAPRFETQTTTFHEALLLPADLVLHSRACPSVPQRSLQVSGKRCAALKPGGRFARQLFGERDDWSSAGRAPQEAITFQRREEVEALLDGLIVERLDEHDEDGRSYLGPKHWHYFDIVARRPALKGE
jgi:hypothetical protein